VQFTLVIWQGTNKY
jgi:Ras-related protein Rab-5C